MAQTDVLLTEVTPPQRTIRWGALILGVLSFIAFQFCFMLLGSAIGLSAFDFGGQAPGGGSLFAAGLFGWITILLSFFLAGYVSSRFAEYRTGRQSFLQGFGTWAVITALMAYLVGSGFGAVMGGLGSMARSLVQGGASNIENTESTVRRNAPDLSPDARERITRDATRVANDARQGLAGTSGFLFISLAFGPIACILGALVNHRQRYRIENRIAGTLDEQEHPHRPKRAA